jgi:serine protease AprX
MNRLFYYPGLIVLLMLAAHSAPPAAQNRAGKLSLALAQELASLPSGETRPVWVYLSDKGFDPDSPGLMKEILQDRAQSMRERCLHRRAKARPGQERVDFEDIAVFPAYTERIRAMVPRVRTVSRWLNALSVEAGLKEVEALASLGFVRRLEPVASFRRSEEAPPQFEQPVSSVDGFFNRIYGPSRTQLEQLNVPSLHLMGYSGQGVVVCLLDVGFHKSHPVFKAARLLAEWDFVNGDGDVQQNLNDPQDYSDSHGTGTWSALGGFMPGQLIGPAFRADFILGKTETERFERPIEEDYWEAGIEWAESLGADVVSSSLGYTDWYTFKDLDGKTAVTTLAADRAAELGVVVVNAAGNERDDAWGHIIAPADGFKVIAVGAVSADGRIASFSSPGPTYDGRIKPEVCALGVSTWIAGLNADGSPKYGPGSGTSFATPLVAGVVALLLEAHPDWTPDDVRAALLATASRSTTPDNDYGWGIVNALAALKK